MELRTVTKMNKTVGIVGAAILLSITGNLSGTAYAASYVKVADEWGTIRPDGARSATSGNRFWNTEGGGIDDPTLSSSGTLRFYMDGLVNQLNTDFPAGWTIDDVTLVVEHDDFGASLGGSVSIFHFTNDALAITNDSDSDGDPGDFAGLDFSPLIYDDASTSGGQPVRVFDFLAGGEANMGTVTRVNDYMFSYSGTDDDGNLDVFGTAASLVDPAGATNVAPDYALSFPTVNPDDSLATFATEVAADSGGWLAGAVATIAADIADGTDALSFIFAATDDFSTVVATYKGNVFNELYPPRIYIEANSTAVGLPGDYNENDVVDAADYTIWRDSVGQNITLPNSDPSDMDGVVTQAEYDFWKSQFGMTLGSGSLSSSAVPEPSAFVLLLVGLLGLAGTHRRSSRRI